MWSRAAMVRRFLRLPALRTLVPRAAAPVLPISRGALTNKPRAVQPRFFSQFPARVETPRTTSQSHAPQPSLSQRLKHLIKSYGWYALGVYTVLTILDFGVAFAAINLLGARQVSQVTDTVKHIVHDIIHSKPPEPGREDLDPLGGADGNVDGNGGLYAMLVLAYTVHKTLFLPVRVGLTAWFTPRLVGWLRQRGWAGAGAKRAMADVRESLRGRDTW